MNFYNSIPLLAAHACVQWHTKSYTCLENSCQFFFIKHFILKERKKQDNSERIAFLMLAHFYFFERFPWHLRCIFELNGMECNGVIWFYESILVWQCCRSKRKALVPIFLFWSFRTFRLNVHMLFSVTYANTWHFKPIQFSFFCFVNFHASTSLIPVPACSLSLFKL